MKRMMPNFESAKKDLLFRMKNELKPTLYYHNLSHTKDVIHTSELLSTVSKINYLERILVKTGALYHDSGFLIQYQNHEDASIAIAESSLGVYGYSPEQINVVKNIIKATKMPQSPKNLLEEIVCDADLGCLGKRNYFQKLKLLRQELEANGFIFTDRKWVENTLKLYEIHEYFTIPAKILFQKGKENNCKKLEKMLKKL